MLWASIPYAYLSSEIAHIQSRSNIFSFLQLLKKVLKLEMLTEIIFLIILNFNRFSVPNIKYRKKLCDIMRLTVLE